MEKPGNIFPVLDYLLIESNQKKNTVNLVCLSYCTKPINSGSPLHFTSLTPFKLMTSYILFPNGLEARLSTFDINIDSLGTFKIYIYTKSCC